MGKKIAVAVGGTGGHIYPAIALADALRQRDDDIDIHFFGGGLATNPFLKGARIASTEIPSATFASKRRIGGQAVAAVEIARGWWTARKGLRKYQPDLVIGFGSFHSLPVLLAAKWMGAPIVLHEGNRIPGRVNRLFSRYAGVTGIHFPDTAAQLHGPSVLCEMPLRLGYREQRLCKEHAREELGLDPDKGTLLIFGGSQGAAGINRLVRSAVPQMAGLGLQVIHLTGDRDAIESIDQTYRAAGVQAKVFPFLTRMDLAWQAASLVVARAGASTIGEQMAFGVPAILIPYPHAADNHQLANAKYVQETIGGAVVRQESTLTPETLIETIRTLDEQAMRDAIDTYIQQTQTTTLDALVCAALGVSQ
jgi:UDP-N-acetylglucosamine--N-acetylmuramyl-(pentapeptide) pyrophosphoryl-undecaprenol N-acetylglucosamine transferase